MDNYPRPARLKAGAQAPARPWETQAGAGCAPCSANAGGRLTLVGPASGYAPKARPPWLMSHICHGVARVALGLGGLVDETVSQIGLLEA